MIRKILTYYAERLDDPNKMVVSLLNVERETAGGISAPVQCTQDGYVRTQPPLLLNLNVMLAAVFDERQYAESLSVLSDTLRFIQSVPKFEVEGVDYTIEIVSVTTQDLNNVWTLLGGQYYPSVVCKIRRLTIDAGEIGTGGKTADKPIIEM